LEDYFKNFN